MTRAGVVALLALSILASPRAWAQERDLVVISDLHMGLGRGADGRWLPNEDFRWPNALAGFLRAIDAGAKRPIDLVIAGDFLELWESSFGRCTKAPGGAGASERGDGQPGPDYGCTVPEIAAVAKEVVRAHAAELGFLAEFAARNGNCLYVLAGNHDAALLLDEAWAPVAAALAAGSCVKRPADGLWKSPDGQILVEHGHLVPYDPNGYASWPQITKKFGGVDYLEQPWGEHFVQRLYTESERTYPLIDNLSPHSAGLRYRMDDRGRWGTTRDVATFVKFNLLETSLRQKIDVLTVKEGEPPVWVESVARDLGHRLFLGAMDPEDPFAVALRTRTDADWSQLREELDRLARDPERLPTSEVLGLCDQLALRKAAVSCRDPQLGLGASYLIDFFSRQHIPASHVALRWKALRTLDTWIYGHTHAFELEWKTEPAEDYFVRIFNTGAFQRLLDDERLRELAAASKVEPLEILKDTDDLSELPACYTAVRVVRAGPDPKKEVLAWRMEELGEGSFVDPCAKDCARVGHGCKSEGSR